MTVFFNFLVRFHMAHLYEICGRHKNAQGAYEQLAKMEDTPVRVKHQCYKQLGKILAACLHSK